MATIRSRKISVTFSDEATGRQNRLTRITTIFYIFKCLILYPVFVFFWFCVMAGFLFLLGRNQSTESIMLVAMGVVGAIRVCSYYNEALATDLSKILPFALLGILIIDNSLLRIVDSAEGVKEAALLWETLVYYLAAVVVIEFILRMATGLFRLITGRSKSSRQKDEQGADPVQDAPVPARNYSPVQATEPPWYPPQPAPAFLGGSRSSEGLDVPTWNASRRRQLGPLERRNFVSSDVTGQHERPPGSQPGLV